MNSRCFCREPCFEVATPKSILEDTEVDVFATALYSYRTHAWYNDLYYLLWAKYRIRMINSCDTDLWQQTLADKLDEVLIEMMEYLDAYYALDDDEKVDFITDSGKTTSEYQTEDLPDTPIAEGDEYLSNRGRTITTTEGARSKLYSLKFAYEERMDLIEKVAVRCGPLFLNRWC